VPLIEQKDKVEAKINAMNVKKREIGKDLNPIKAQIAQL